MMFDVQVNNGTEANGLRKLPGFRQQKPLEGRTPHEGRKEERGIFPPIMYLTSMSSLNDGMACITYRARVEYDRNLLPGKLLIPT